jgi:phospholipase/lecithinase/hemolysin
MQSNKRRVWMGAMSALVIAGLVACGGNNPTPIHKVYVMGDSLADVGTFGFKFTVQDANSSKGFPIWPQIVANNVGIDGSAQCNFFQFNGTTFGPNSTSGCTNYAIGGGRIVVKAADGGSANPQTVGTQLKTRGLVGKYTANDLLLIDGGGNDAADLVSAYLGAGSGQAGLAAYQAFLAQQLDTATIAALLPQANGPALAAGAYMQKLADTFVADITTHALNNGADRVAVLNMPDITLTPRFRAVLAGVAAQAGASASAQLQGAIQQWIGAFNQQLKTRTATEKRIVVVDFFNEFTQQVAKPASYGLSNATEAVCPVTGTDSSGLPSYTFPLCTNAALNALPGKTASWWSNYMFSDGFHPTPFAHTLLAQSVMRSLDQAGWR